MSSFKERLAGLNRQYRPIMLKSVDGEIEEKVFYRRPTEMEDELLRKDMEDEFEHIRDRLKRAEEGKESLYDTLYRNFIESKVDNAIGYIVLERIPGIRAAAMLEAGLENLKDDATQEDKDAWMEKFKPPFDRMVQEAKDEWKDTPHEVLASRAAESRVENIARERAYEVYRRCLIAQSIYGQDEEENYVRIFAGNDKKSGADEVSEWLDKDTIDALASKIVEEVNRNKNVPLKSAAVA